MSALTFTVINQPSQRVDLSPLVCQNLANLDNAQIASIELQCGNRLLKVAELFTISGSDSQNVLFVGSSNKFDFIGKDLEGGSITVQGDVGAYLGMQLKSGTIKVTGNAGIYAGCQMRNGAIEITGNAGDFVGGALPGNKQGMKGGIVLIKGNAGARVGDHLRRGLILIEGNCGDYCGSRMLAGTIAVMGQTGRYAGYAMRRGTLLLWQQTEVSANFNDCGTHTLGFLPMLFKSFKALDSRFSESDAVFNRVQRFAGDMATTGKGEILVRTLI